MPITPLTLEESMEEIDRVVMEYAYDSTKVINRGLKKALKSYALHVFGAANLNIIIKLESDTNLMGEMDEDEAREVTKYRAAYTQATMDLGKEFLIQLGKK